MQFCHSSSHSFFSLYLISTGFVIVNPSISQMSLKINLEDNYDSINKIYDIQLRKTYLATSCSLKSVLFSSKYNLVYLTQIGQFLFVTEPFSKNLF